MRERRSHFIDGIDTSQQPGIQDGGNRVATKRKRTVQFTGDIPWTASRCNRLLRTITSRINLLQRLSSTTGSASRTKPDFESDDQPCVKHPRRLGHNATTDQTRLLDAGASPTKDPEWVLTHKSKSIGKTYCSKPKAQRPKTDHVRSKTLRQEFPTPFVKRMLRPVTNPTLAHSEELCSPVNQRASERAVRKSMQLPVRAASCVEEAHRTLISALENLLTITETTAPESGSGASSLMRICLRRVPEYIELEEQAFGDSNDGDSPDTTFDLYSELELLGTKLEGGWPGLREIVRAHGIRRICQAIKQNLFPDHVIDALVGVCNRCHATEDSQALLQSSLDRAHPPKSAAVQAILEFGLRYSCEAFSLRVLRELLLQGGLPKRDLTSSPIIWQMLVKAIIRRESQAGAIAFLEAFVSTFDIDGQSLPEGPAIKNVATLLIAVAIMSAAGQTLSETLSCRIAHAFHRMSAIVWLQTNGGISPHRSSRPATSEDRITFFTGSVVLMSLGLYPIPELCSMSLDTLAEEISNSNGSDTQKRTFYRLRADFICDIAKHLKHFDKETGCEALTDILNGIKHAAKTADAETSHVLQRLAFDSAMAAADSHEGTGMITFAEEVESMATRNEGPARPQTPRTKPRLSKYRWEDGLSEWIAITPLGTTDCGGATFEQDIVALATPVMRRPCPLEQPAASLISHPPNVYMAQPPPKQIKRRWSEIQDVESPVARAPRTEKHAKLQSKPSMEDAIEKENITPSLEDDDDLDELALHMSVKKKIGHSTERVLATGEFIPNSRFKRLSSGSFTKCLPNACETIDASDDELGM